MNKYELLFILPGTLTEEEVSPLVEKIKTSVTESGAEGFHLKELGKNRLAYPIKHIRYGYFFLANFEAEKEKLADMRSKLGMMSEPLRALIQNYDPAKQAKVKMENFTTAEQARAPRLPEKPRPQESIELESVPVAKKPKEKKEEKPKKKVSLEEIGVELDKILDTEIDV